VDLLWGVRGLAQDIVDGALKAGLRGVRYFASSEDASEAILSEVRKGDLILIKGSRGVATDKIVTALRNNFPLAGEDSEK
jgi:UDP-N-acetylmuramoyl-tripeptide--D-alanyl-D-alanine ligase